MFVGPEAGDGFLHIFRQIVLEGASRTNGRVPGLHHRTLQILGHRSQRHWRCWFCCHFLIVIIILVAIPVLPRYWWRRRCRRRLLRHSLFCFVWMVVAFLSGYNYILCWACLARGPNVVLNKVQSIKSDLMRKPRERKPEARSRSWTRVGWGHGHLMVNDWLTDSLTHCVSIITTLPITTAHTVTSHQSPTKKKKKAVSLGRRRRMRSWPQGKGVYL